MMTLTVRRAEFLWMMTKTRRIIDFYQFIDAEKGS